MVNRCELPAVRLEHFSGLRHLLIPDHIVLRINAIGKPYLAIPMQAKPKIGGWRGGDGTAQRRLVGDVRIGSAQLRDACRCGNPAAERLHTRMENPGGQCFVYDCTGGVYTEEVVMLLHASMCDPDGADRQAAVARHNRRKGRNPAILMAYKMEQYGSLTVCGNKCLDRRR
jgi:hypothetical protein